MTPYEFGILLHYYSRCGDPEEIVAPIGPSTVDQFLAADLLQHNTDPSRVRRYRLTERGVFYVEAVLATPLPVQRWEIPQASVPVGVVVGK